MSLLSALIDDDALGLSAGGSVPIAKREVHFAIRRDGLGGDGTPQNPFNGSDPDTLDTRLSTIPRNTRIVFGPGIFRTRGCGRSGSEAGPWLGLLEEQELIGAGMFVTTLRLDLIGWSGAPLVNVAYGVLQNRFEFWAHGVRIQDMTLDADVNRVPATPPYNYPRVMTFGAHLFGNNLVIKRVRVINAATRTPGYEYGFVDPNGFPNNGRECFPIASGCGSLSISDFRIEECIVERPYHSNGRETTCIHIGGGHPTERERSYNYRAAITNCLVDCAIVPAGPYLPVMVESLVFVNVSGSIVGTLVTHRQHDLDVGDKVTIRGSSSFDATYAVSAVLNQWTATLASTGSAGTATGTMTAEKFSKPALMISLAYASGKVTVTSGVPHNRANGDWVHIYPGGGAALGAVVVTNNVPANKINRYYGTFQVENATTFAFEYTLLEAPPLPPAAENWLDRVEQNSGIVWAKAPEMNDSDMMEVVTITPAFRKPGQLIQIGQMITTPAFSEGATINPFGGTFPVVSVENRLLDGQMVYSLKCGPIDYIPLSEADLIWGDIFLSNEFDYNTIDIQFKGVGQGFQGLGAFSHKQGCYEGNRVSNVVFGTYGDTGSDYDLTVRKNYYRNVQVAVYFPVQYWEWYPLSTATYWGAMGLEPAGYVYGTTGTEAHKLEDSDIVQYFVGSEGARYGTIKALTPLRFLIEGEGLTGNPQILFLPLNKRKATKIEQNLIEMALSFPGAGWSGYPGKAYGIILTYQSSPVPTGNFAHTHGAIQIRGNYIRPINAAAMPTNYMLPNGINVVSADESLIENNIIDLPTDLYYVQPQWGVSIRDFSSIQMQFVSTAQILNNRSSDGQLLPATTVSGGLPSLRLSGGVEAVVETSLLHL